MTRGAAERGGMTGSVLADMISQGVWLSSAARKFGSPDIVNQYELASKNFTAAAEGTTPEMHRMSSRLVGPELEVELLNKLSGDQRKWWRLFRRFEDLLQTDLRTRLHFGSLIAFGDPGFPGATPEWIPVRAWFRLRVDPAVKDTVRGEGMNFFYVRVIDPIILNQISQQDIPRTSRVRAIILKALQEFMSRSDPPTKAEALACCEKIPGYYKQAFEDAWKELPDRLKRARGKHGPPKHTR